MSTTETPTPWSPHVAEFHEVLYEQLKKTPWFMVSLVVHLVAFLVLGNLGFADVARDTPKRLEARVEPEMMDELIETEEEEIEEEVPEEEPTEQPDAEEVRPDDVVDDKNTESEDDTRPDQPFDGRQDNTAIGLGGGLGGGAFGGRGPGKMRNKYGGDATAAAAVNRGLDWLARHQTPDEGYWDCDGFQAQCDGDLCDGRGYPVYDPGVTGLALLAFLGAGYTHVSGKYKDNVGNALKYLKRIQDPEGCFGTQAGHYMYSHACCTLALAEAYGMTRSELLRRPVEKGLAFLCRAQNPNPSGTGKLAWRYTVQPGENDTSVTGWCVMALKSAQVAGLDVPQAAMQGARAWIEQMTDPVTGRCGYVQSGVSPVRATGRADRWPSARSEAITAVAMLSRVFLGEDPDQSASLKQGAKLLMERLPRWQENDGSIDHYYWYYGTLAMFQQGGGGWKKWNQAMKRAIVDHQIKQGCASGSWDPSGPWGEDGGRVYSTALMTMCLEVYYRYPRVFGTR